MDYLFKAKTSRAVKIDANNLEEAKRFFLEEYVIINTKKRTPEFEEGKDYEFNPAGGKVFGGF